MEDPKCPVKEMSEMSVGEKNSSGMPAQNRVSRPIRNGASGNDSSSPIRRVQRNKSGPQGRMTRVGRALPNRAPPKRSQSSKIKRPTFHPVSPDGDGATDQHQGKRRGVNRSHSNKVKGPTRNVPARSGSFQRRRVPDRTCSSSSLRRAAAKRQQQLGNVSVTNSTAETDDISVSDSVFTSISIQTMDSIMVRKKQIPPNQEKHGVNREMAIEFDDTINGMGQADYYDGGADGDGYEYDEELSIFSESWCSSESCEVLSDYEEGEMDGAILEHDEDRIEDESGELSPEKKTVGCSSAE
mmetsp:Transcript_11838/g.30022  ORF Transcript_11838/g.30022 Transcript_11838/m.30022 type:complete len:298 (+) Transcript_11838:215-1108(+)